VAAGFEGIFHIAAGEGMNASNERGQGARDGVRDQIDERGAGDDGHQAEPEKKVVEPQEIRIGFAVGF
jgi:hypothetical protein